MICWNAFKAHKFDSTSLADRTGREASTTSINKLGCPRRKVKMVNIVSVTPSGSSLPGWLPIFPSLPIPSCPSECSWPLHQMPNHKYWLLSPTSIQLPPICQLGPWGRHSRFSWLSKPHLVLCLWMVTPAPTHSLLLITGGLSWINLHSIPHSPLLVFPAKPLKQPPRKETHLFSLLLQDRPSSCPGSHGFKCSLSALFSLDATV